MTQDLIKLLLLSARYELGLAPVGQREVDSCWPDYKAEYPQEMKVTHGNELLYNWMVSELDRLPLHNKRVILAYLWSGDEVDTFVAAKRLSTSPCHLYKVYQESLAMLAQMIDRDKFRYWKNVLF